MSAVIIWAAVTYAQTALALAVCFAGWRALKGPRAQDRVVGLDTLYVVAMLLLLVTGIRTGGSYYFEAALVISVLGFVTSASLAKFLMRGEVIE